MVILAFLMANSLPLAVTAFTTVPYAPQPNQLVVVKMYWSVCNAVASYRSPPTSQ